MNFQEMLANLKFKAKRNGPKLLMIGGTVSVVGGVVTACVATRKVDIILAEHKKAIETIHTVAEDKSGEFEYSEKDAQKDLTITYTKTGVKLIGLYLPSVLLTGTGLACFWGSHGIMKGRNVALAAAYATIDKGFKEYRARVVEKYGQDAEDELYFNSATEKMEVVKVDKNGKEKKSEVKVTKPSIDEASSYMFYFDSNCGLYDDNNEMNIHELQLQQQFLNDKLCAQKYLTLNDVRKALGAKPTKTGQVVGWVYRKSNEVGDNYVDLGLYKPINADAMNPAKPECNVFIIDPNVDGYILDIALDMGLIEE